jgi:hypothetical protein
VTSYYHPNITFEYILTRRILGSANLRFGSAGFLLLDLHALANHHKLLDIKGG